MSKTMGKTTKPKLKTCLVRCRTMTELGWAEYGVITISAEFAAQMRARHEAFLAAKRSDDQLYTMEFWCFRMTYYDYEVAAEKVEALLTKEQLERLEGGAPIEIAPDALANVEECRTECDCVVVTTDSFYFTAIVKHTDVRVDSDLLSYKLLGGLL